jgi:hypothetical protein
MDARLVLPFPVRDTFTLLLTTSVRAWTNVLTDPAEGPPDRVQPTAPPQDRGDGRWLKVMDLEARKAGDRLPPEMVMYFDVR